MDVKPWFHVKIKIIILKNFRPAPPPSVDRPTKFFIFQAWFHDKMK